MHVRHTESQNEALCLEILSVMRRCLAQQADIRLILYEASDACVCACVYVFVRVCLCVCITVFTGYCFSMTHAVYNLSLC